MAEERTEYIQRPHILEIGMLELGPFADGKFVTTMEAIKFRKAMKEGQPIE